MDDQTVNDNADKEKKEGAVYDLDQGPHVGFITSAEFEDRVHLEMHQRQHPHDRAHVDLSQEEYTPQEVARMMGTSLEVVMHAIWNGNLKAERKGRNVVCIQHTDVVDWLRRRGPGV